MTFLELAKKRSSVRSFLETPVEEAKLLKVLEAGRVAPSAVNFQPWTFIVLRDPSLLKKVAATYHREWLLKAPVIIVACGDHSTSWRRDDGKDFCDIDLAIAIDHLTLAAIDLGLGTCWVCNFNQKRCQQILKLPEELEPIALLPLGYPAKEVDLNRHETKRKPLEEIVFWDGYHSNSKKSG